MCQKLPSVSCQVAFHDICQTLPQVACQAASHDMPNTATHFMPGNHTWHMSNTATHFVPGNLSWHVCTSLRGVDTWSYVLSVKSCWFTEWYSQQCYQRGALYRMKRMVPGTECLEGEDTRSSVSIVHQNHSTQLCSVNNSNNNMHIVTDIDPPTHVCISIVYTL